MARARAVELAAMLLEASVAWGSANTLRPRPWDFVFLLFAVLSADRWAAGAASRPLLPKELLAAATAMPHVVAAKGAAAAANARVLLPSP